MGESPGLGCLTWARKARKFTDPSLLLLLHSACRSSSGPRSPPVASPGSGQLPSFARTSSASGNSLFGMLNRAGYVVPSLPSRPSRRRLDDAVSFSHILSLAADLQSRVSPS